MIEQMRKISLVAPASLGVPLFAFLQEDGHVHLALPEHSQADDGIVNRLLLLRESSTLLSRRWASWRTLQVKTGVKDRREPILPKDCPIPLCRFYRSLKRVSKNFSRT